MTRVNRAATATTLTLSPNAVPPGGQSTITATVAVLPPGDVDVNGALQFSVDGAAVGAPIALGGGAIGYQATVTAPTIPGTYAVGVTYSGDADTEPSSASAAQVVTAPAAASAGASSTKVAASQLKAMASTLVTALRLHGLAALASTAQTLTAGPGVVEQKVSSTNAPRGARAAARKPIVLASGRHRFPTAGTGTLRLKLTSAGRRAIRRAKSLKLVIVTRYTPTGGSAVTATQRLTVRAKGRRRARAATASGWQLTGSRVSR